VLSAKGNVDHHYKAVINLPFSVNRVPTNPDVNIFRNHTEVSFVPVLLSSLRIDHNSFERVNISSTICYIPMLFSCQHVSTKNVLYKEYIGHYLESFG